MALHHGVGIHDPRHRLRIGVHVRRWNILVRSDQRQNFASEPARHPFQFALGHALRIADDAALCSAERHVHHRRLPGHPRRQRFHFIQRNVGMIANAAFAWPARNVVLHAESGHHAQLAVIHFRRQRHFQDPFGRPQHLPQSWIELQEFRRHVKLDLRDAKRIQILARSNPRHERLDCWLYDRGHRRRSFPLLGVVKSFIATSLGSCTRSGPNGKNRKRKIYLSLATQEFAARRKTLFSYFARHSCEQKWCVSPFALSGNANSSAMCIPQTGSLTSRLLLGRASCPTSLRAPGAASL